MANSTIIQVNLFQKHFFLHQLTQNMTIDCSWNYLEKYKRRTWAEHVILWVNWCKNRSFWQRFTCTDVDLIEACTNRPILPPIFGTFVQIFYALVCLVGLCGNTLVIYVVLRYSKMQTVTYIYILMLAIADEIFLFGIPFLVVTMARGYWIFGFNMCKIYYTTTSINQVSFICQIL